MVSYTDAFGSKVLPKLFEVTIAQFTGCHLNTYLVQCSVFTGIKMCQMEGTLPILAQMSNEILVPVRLSPPKMEITMYGFNPIA